MEIQKIKDHDNEGGMSLQEVLDYIKKKGIKLITNPEADAMLQDDKQRAEFYPYLPCWTGTRIKYAAGAKEALVWNPGEKPKKIPLPLKDGWYLPDAKYGIPNGEPSNILNSKARHLWRYQNSAYDGLVSRLYCVDWDGGIRRGVCCGDVDWRLGVLSSGKAKKHKHVWETLCKICGEKK